MKYGKTSEQAIFPVQLMAKARRHFAIFFFQFLWGGGGEGFVHTPQFAFKFLIGLDLSNSYIVDNYS